MLHPGGCLPLALLDGADGVPCSVYAVLPSVSSAAACNEAMGLSAVNPSLASVVQGAAQAPTTAAVCAIRQLTTGAYPNDFQDGTCTDATDPGWCYVTGAAAGNCPQAIAFSNALPPPGAVAVLGCR